MAKDIKELELKLLLRGVPPEEIKDRAAKRADAGEDAAKALEDITKAAKAAMDAIQEVECYDAHYDDALESAWAALNDIATDAAEAAENADMNLRFDDNLELWV